MGSRHLPAKAFVALLVLALLGPMEVQAQCPDGTPPPCGKTRQPDPPLDGRTWIVVPFENVSRNAEIDWLREASVNLLYLDLSRWKDIRVIDDERVFDLVSQHANAAAASRQLTLTASLALARRAGAGHLVMGDLLKIGNRTRVVAKVFETRTGRRVRSVEEGTSNQDSLISLFGRLAPRVVGAATASVANLGTIGTSRLDAYKEYVIGVAAFNRVDLVEARARFERALQLDSTFALAHYKLAVLAHWAEASRARRMGAVRDPHADAAAQFSASLPARERSLIAALAALHKGDYARSCGFYSDLVGADSSDVEALLGLGECHYQDVTVEPLGDSLHWRFRTSWNTSLRLWRRVLALDPTYHFAFGRIMQILRSNERTGCVIVEDPMNGRCDAVGGATGPAERAAAMVRRRRSATVRRENDSLITIAMRFGPAYLAEREEVARAQTRRRNLLAARMVAEEWVSAAPSQPRARRELAQIYLELGMPFEAASQFELAHGALTSLESVDLVFTRVDALLKTYSTSRIRMAMRILDSAWASARPDSSAQAFYARDASRLEMGLLFGAFGRMEPIDSATARPAYGVPPETWARSSWFLRQQSQIMIGENVDRSPTADTAALTATPLLSLSWIGPAYGLRHTQSSWPGLNPARSPARMAPAIALIAADTAKLRLAANALDSALNVRAARLEPEDGTSITAADAYLLLGDSVAALRVLRRALDTTFAHTRLTPNPGGSLLATLVTGGNGPLPLALVLPRAALLRADLAAARGALSEARAWYAVFLAFWQDADAELRPSVDRARRALATLEAR